MRNIFWAQNQVFCDFLKFSSLVFLEIAYNDGLQQFLTFSRGETPQKILVDQIQVKLKSAQNQVFCYFLKFYFLVFLEITQDDDSLGEYLNTSRGKTGKKN